MTGVKYKLLLFVSPASSPENVADPAFVLRMISLVPLISPYSQPLKETFARHSASQNLYFKNVV